VVPLDLDSTERAEAGSATFTAGLKALRRGKHRGATFEFPGGDPAELLVARSVKALGLVVGEDRPTSEATGGVEVAEYCRANARCPVHVVPRAGSVTSRDQSHWGPTGSSRNMGIEPAVATRP
jgi:hypothetical protein